MSSENMTNLYRESPATSLLPVQVDARSLSFAGRRTLLISGEIHYLRSPRAEWLGLLDRSVACGLNGIASYVFWNEHEPRRDVYDFAGDRDLRHFLSLCRERGLRVLLRMGPYCCAEWNYGGYPPYLRDEPGITIRTWNRPYLDRVEKYCRHLVAEFLPYLATCGGPVVLVQVENEYANVAKRYGEEGQRYLTWLAELVKSLGVDVPLIMCEGGAEGTVETVWHLGDRELKVQVGPEGGRVWDGTGRLLYDTGTATVEMFAGTWSAVEVPMVWDSQCEPWPGDGYRHAYRFQATRGRHRLDILAMALGLVKGDWMLAAPMQTECKGIWRPVTVNGRPQTGWEIAGAEASMKSQGIKIMHIVQIDLNQPGVRIITTDPNGDRPDFHR